MERYTLRQMNMHGYSVNVHVQYSLEINLFQDHLKIMIGLKGQTTLIHFIFIFTLYFIIGTSYDRQTWLSEFQEFVRSLHSG